jgi:hypothetical protein
VYLPHIVFQLRKLLVEFAIRFLIGGLVVSAFAIAGDMLKPRRFAGLLGAAPSIALATLTLTVMKNGVHYATVEARSMILGAIAFACYASRPPS